MIVNETWYLVRNTEALQGFVTVRDPIPPTKEEVVRWVLRKCASTRDVETGDTIRIIGDLSRVRWYVEDISPDS